MSKPGRRAGAHLDVSGRRRKRSKPGREAVVRELPGATNERGPHDGRKRRKKAAKRARSLAGKKSNAMPVAPPLDGPRVERVVDAELVDPAPRGGLVEVFQQRYLLRLIVQRQVAQQYAASVLGLLWSYIQPAMRFAVYFFIFSTVLKTHGGDTPNFALRLFTGMVFLHYFSETWGSGTRSVRGNKALLLKMRMPREIFPIASMLTAMYHTGPQMLLLIVICLLVGWSVSLTSIGAALLGLAILLSFSMTMALLFSALNVYWKDFQNIVGTFTQFLHFLVPMLYPYSLIASVQDTHPTAYQLYMANPLAEVVLLMQRFFWYPSFDDPDGELLRQNFPPDLWERGFIMLGILVVCLYGAQKLFARLEPKFPERL